MKNTVFALIIIIVSFSHHSSLSQWTQTNGPSGANIFSIESSGDDLFAGVEVSGIMYSDNHGADWRKIGYEGFEVRCLAHDGSALYASPGDRIVKTTNLGISWDSCFAISGVSCLTARNGVIVAGTIGNGVLISTDNGSTWANSNNGLPSSSVADVEIYNGGLYAIPFGTGIYRSVDYGGNWSCIGLADHELSELEVINNNFYAASIYPYPASVFVSYDGGSNWSVISNGIHGEIYSFAYDGTYIFASGNDGIFRSSNGGGLWELCETGMYYVNSMAASGGEVFAGSPRNRIGMIKTTDNGETWNSAMNVMNPVIPDLAESGGVLYAAAEYGGAKHTTNRGDVWLPAGMQYEVLTGLAANDNNIYVSTIRDQAGLYRSSDRGTTWHHIGSGYAYDISAFAVTNERAYVSTRNPHNPGLLMTTDNGLNWLEIGDFYAASCLYARDNELIVSSMHHGMFWTTNAGVNWTSMNNGTPVSYSGSIIGKGPMIFAAFSNNGVYATSNRGASWISANNGLTVLNVNCFAVYANKLYAGTTDGVFVSTNDGGYWSNASGGLEYRRISSLATLGGYLFAATYSGGVWRMNLEAPLPVELSGFSARVVDSGVFLEWSTTLEINNFGFDIERSDAYGSTWNTVGFVSGKGTVNKVSEYSFTDINPATGSYRYRLKQIDFNGNFEYFELPEAVTIGVPDKFFLGQNYPNPFNPLTTIVYGIPVAGNVTLKVFDMSGREVVTLVSEFKDAGYHTAKLDASGIASGAYAYRIESGSFVSAKKMIVLK